jgi:hypothetical protein
LTLIYSAPWFKKGCNLPAGAAVDPAADDHLSLADHQPPAATQFSRVFDIPDATISDIGSRLLAASEALRLDQDVRCHVPCESLLQEAVANGSQWPRLRHLRQQLSIAAHLQLCDGLTPRHVIVELGAGKAGLSRTLCRGHPGNTYVLVDRQSFKSKKDCRMRDEKEGAAADQMYVRVRCDVQDLRLSAVDVCLKAPVSIVGKHLCGGCTDLSMRASCHWQHDLQCSTPGLCSLCDPAAASAAPQSPAATPPAATPPAAMQPAVDAFLVATCCHHRMTWEVFAGQQQWLGLGFSQADFDIARRVSAWHNLWGAACVAAESGGAAGGESSSREQRSFGWMRSVGRAAKDVFDACRRAAGCRG